MAEKLSTDSDSAAPTFSGVEQGIEAARDAGLRYSTDERPGIIRKKVGKRFAYLDSSGARISDKKTLARIKALAVPPAWSDVWICPFENGHLQATGRDLRRRKQYRYHDRWRELRDEHKFERVVQFAKALPQIRRSVKRDLLRPGMPREKVLAAIIFLLETTLIRVGNEQYVRENRSYGLTTMRNRHAKVAGPLITFSFKGKSGKRHEIDIQNRQLAMIVKRCQELPYQQLFTYLDEHNRPHDIGSEDVNEYLREIAGSEFTAKDFRTWAGTVLAARALRELNAVASIKAARTNIGKAIEAVARVMGNTAAICRKCYVHPTVLEAYLKTGSIQWPGGKAAAKNGAGLRHDEKCILSLLEGTPL